MEGRKDYDCFSSAAMTSFARAGAAEMTWLSVSSDTDPAPDLRVPQICPREFTAMLQARVCVCVWTCEVK